MDINQILSNMLGENYAVIGKTNTMPNGAEYHTTTAVNRTTGVTVNHTSDSWKANAIAIAEDLGSILRCSKGQRYE